MKRTKEWWCSGVSKFNESIRRGVSISSAPVLRKMYQTNQWDPRAGNDDMFHRKLTLHRVSRAVVMITDGATISRHV